MSALDETSDVEALDDWRISYLGRRGELTQVLRGLGSLPAEERPAAGAAANALRRTLEEAISSREDALKRAASERLRNLFSRWCKERGHESASDALERDWERMVMFYDYPKEHWQHLRTTNPVESPFASLRLRTDAAKRYKRVDRAIAVIWKMLMVVEQRFRRLNALELMKAVYDGEKYEDGVAMQNAEEIAARLRLHTI